MAVAVSPGTKIRVKSGVQAPDLPQFELSGWSGTITQSSGKKGSRKIFIEWDQETIESMGEAYLAACEEKQLYHLMACLSEEDLEIAD